ncbi:MAG: type II toxin-antitoxin system RelE/ParE family toxin [Bacteroidia bacterium]
MSYTIVLLQRAVVEISEAYIWYETQSKGLGDKFLSVLEKYKTNLLRNPELCKQTYKKFRESVISTFPFLLIYYIDRANKKIIIVSVFHCSRNPKKKF